MRENKTRILNHFCNDCQEQSDGRIHCLFLMKVYKNFLKRQLIHVTMRYEALTMMKLVKILRWEIFEWSSFNFAGSFPCDCQNNSVPSTLKLLISLLLNGCNMKSPNVIESQASLTISQLIYFNARKNYSTINTIQYNSRHWKDREPPPPLYVGLNVHTLTRNKKIVNLLYKLGVSVSYVWLASSLEKMGEMASIGDWLHLCKKWLQGYEDLKSALNHYMILPRLVATHIKYWKPDRVKEADEFEMISMKYVYGATLRSTHQLKTTPTLDTCTQQFDKSSTTFIFSRATAK